MSRQSNKGDKKKLKLRKLKAKLAERDKQHARGIMEVSRAIQRDFERKAEELVTFVASLPESNNLGDSAFTFARNRALAVRAERIIRELNATTTKRILATIRNAERLSAEKYQSILDVYKVSEGTFSSIITPDYTRELSKRVWAIGEQFGKEMELAIDTALLNGTSAKDLSREVRGLLREPHKLFRRVRDKRGELQLSKAARAYKPGQGVYRSSFKNAMRLASTETNISYRSSDYERWNALDFVQGIEIDLSNNHPVYDICDELRGRYPKDFKFVGWHPHCRCIATPILPDPDRFEKYYLGQADTPSDADNYVTDMPKNFKQWEKANADRIAKAELKGKLPYFLRDNPHRRSKGKETTRKEEEGKTKKTKRVRTELERKAIQASWDERNKYSKIVETLQANKVPTLDVRRLEKPLSIEEIVAKLGGLDKTDGSCSSLAYAYAANRNGLDVTDYRGGVSRLIFSNRVHIRELTEKVGGVVVKEFNDFKAAMSLFKAVEKGKEYYFFCGGHAAIIRRSEAGWLEYLELQDTKEYNGFTPFTNSTLSERFGAQKSHTSHGQKYAVTSGLVDISLFGSHEKGFANVVRYLNTQTSKQMKGAGGSIK